MSLAEAPSRIASLVSSAVVRVRAETNTSAPSSAKRRQSARPVSRPPPVTATLRPTSGPAPVFLIRRLSHLKGGSGQAERDYRLRTGPLPCTERAVTTSTECLSPVPRARSRTPLRRGVLAQEVSRSGARGARLVARIGKPAAAQRQATTADARCELVAESLERHDAIVDPTSPRARKSFPIGLRGCPRVGQRRQCLADLLERQPDLLRGPHERHPAEAGALESPLAAGRPGRRQQPFSLVVAQRRGCQPASCGELADGQQVPR